MLMRVAKWGSTPSYSVETNSIVDTSKPVFTTGEAASICHISLQKIIRCFDSGELEGFRVPESKHRRIPREKLIAFMKKHNISTDKFVDLTEDQDYSI